MPYDGFESRTKLKMKAESDIILSQSEIFGIHSPEKFFTSSFSPFSAFFSVFFLSPFTLRQQKGEPEM